MEENKANDSELDGLEIGEEMVEDESQGEDPSGVTFIPKDAEIPPELKPLVEDIEKGMRRNYIRKTQEVAELRKKFESGTASSAEREKAMLLDRLLQDQNIMAYLAQVQAGTTGASYDEDDSEDPSTAQVRKILAPLQQEVATLKEQTRIQRAIAEKDSFEKLHPNWEREVGKEAMAREFTRNPALSIEEAYDLALVKKLRAAKASKQSQDSNADKVVEGRSSAKKVSEEPVITDFQDAARYALRQAGINPKKVL